MDNRPDGKAPRVVETGGRFGRRWRRGHRPPRPAHAGKRSNIDHLAIAPFDVYVIDGKRYKGKVEVRKPF